MLKILETKPNVFILSVIVVIGVVFNYYSSEILNSYYEKSQFPVPYFEAQLSFNAERLKGWYQFLVDNETMDIYISTQNIDFLFILSVLVLHVSVILLLSRAFELGSRTRKWLVFAAIISALAPLFDALENGVSYIMIANYSDFPDWLAILYSSLAAAKFAMFSFAYMVFFIAIFLWLIVQIKNVINKFS